MPDGNVWNVTKRAYLMVENKISAIHGKPSKGLNMISFLVKERLNKLAGHGRRSLSDDI